MDGNDPSTTDPIAVRIGDALSFFTAAASITANAGTNWMALGSSETAGQDTDLFLYAIAETGAAAGVKLGFSRIPYARLMGDFSSTSTAQGYIKGNYTNKNATDHVTLIGRFNAILGASASFNWSLPGTAIIVNRPIFFTRWLTYVPTVGTTSGSITTLGTITALYRLHASSLFFEHFITITTNGTGAGVVTASLPFSTGTTLAVCAGRETGVTGSILQGRVNSATVNWVDDDNAYPGGDGRIIMGSGSGIRMA
jgi:hypothetical protein